MKSITRFGPKEVLCFPAIYDIGKMDTGMRT